MNAISQAAPGERVRSPSLAALFWAILAITVIVRLAVLAATPLELQYDEAQYWYWSLTPDWGYFSKPPLIAWAIGATTALFGNAEWAVRLAAPLAQAGGAAALYALGRAMYGPAAGFWAGIGWLFMPGIWLSSVLISTDALVLPLWSLALLAAWRLVETGRIGWALALGAAIGLGALAKYAMLYFLLCSAIAIVWAPDMRRALLSRNGLIALLTAAACLAPNIIWNAAHSFATIEHTAANASADRYALHPEELIEFLGGQILVIGPIFLPCLGFLLGRAGSAPGALDLRDRFLIAFCAPPLLIILGQALLSHAHANWAATAYPAAIVWIAGRLAASQAGRFTLMGAAVAHLALGVFMMSAMLSPRLMNAAGLGNAVEDARGWKETAALVAAHARAQGPLTAVVTDHRPIYFELSYYWRRMGEAGMPPLRMWVLRDAAKNHAEAIAPLDAASGERVLFVHGQERYLDLAQEDFRTARLLERREIALGGGQTRPLAFSLAEGFAPRPRDAEFLHRLPE